MAVLQQLGQQDLEDLYSAKASQSDVQTGNLALTGKLLDFQQDFRKRRLASRNAMNSIKSSALGFVASPEHDYKPFKLFLL